MAEVNQRERYVKIKIVYYGPPLGGKTTNLNVLHRRAFAHRRGEMISVNSMQDRTILFDLLPLQTVGPHGVEVRLQLVAAPGQAQYTATRRALLKGADGVAFVANSAADRFDENLLSLRELSRYLADQGIDSASVPLVFQYNKRDLPKVTPTDVLDARLKTRAERAYTAVATSGEGVIQTFEAILGLTLAELSRRFRVLAFGKGESPATWASQAVVNLFGTAPRSAQSPAERGPEPAVRAIRVATSALGAEPLAGQRAAARDEAYAEAAAELAVALAQASSERDQARSRLDDVRRAVEAARRDGDSVTRVRRMLSFLAETGGAAHASFVCWTGARLDGACTLPPLAKDPLLARHAGARFLADLAKLGRPHLEACGEYPEVVALLGRSRPPLQALAAVPVGKPGTRLGLALLYFIEGDALPSPEALEHLALLAGLFELRLETHASPEVILLDPADLVALNAEPELRLAAG